ncbi:Type-3 glutamine synthetase [Zancudomyces culisetae]|uniref:Type-3 glutamine synthetase n=1 Tax=Zancudomyces culisetae TaxID=1213189 RepID=A0A1R1PFU4_ZANCU|nr:Type-3 glutamine synthetase [Zancudomyces culisetae]|eukprot:OMH79885.1 Type-3 glutamine synthetase [Zancudomyces culisetae]
MAYPIRKEIMLKSASKIEDKGNQWPRNEKGRAVYSSELFGENVFSFKQMARSLPKSTFSNFLKQRRGKSKLDQITADAIAHAARVWAMDRGATHFTHWFQPQTGTTAEKHDAFLVMVNTYMQGGDESFALDALSGSQLLQSEPDASSFPTGGMRSTFEARGYTIWDTSSPMFIQEGPNGTMVLYIPSVFISYNGEALDEKTILLRSTEVISKATKEFLEILEPHHRVGQVTSTIGLEQEFFLVDRGMYTLRNDLKITGRTLVGKLPPRHQQLEDHYFGKIPARVLKTLSDVEMDALKLGIPLKTRHNEASPAQFEIAPVFEEASLAVDHNLLTMDLLHKAAYRNGLKVLYHSKPFKGVNGSGKHVNWSLSTDRGENLLDPTVRPENNYRFLLMLMAVLKGIYDYASLLRVAIATSGSEHRLGAAEAPPAITSIFLGDQLSEVLNALEERRPLKNFSVPQFQSIRVGGTLVDLKVTPLPTIPRDLADRNRTSPVAFTGDKLEFRALGANQSPSFFVAAINAAVSAALKEITADLKAALGSKPKLTAEDKLSVIRKYINITRPIRFEGDSYSSSWVETAASRGLFNAPDCPSSYLSLKTHKIKTLLTYTLRIFTPSELESRFHILNERYTNDLLIESNTLYSIVSQQILPAICSYRSKLSSSALALMSISADFFTEKLIIDRISPTLRKLVEANDRLAAHISEVEAEHKSGTAESAAEKARRLLYFDLLEVRSHCDLLESMTPDVDWPMPSYAEILLTF